MGLLSRSQIFTVNSAPTFVRCAKTPWKSIYITGIMAFLTITQFAMFFSSMWPYLQTLDPEITEPFYGYIVGAYSIGSIVTSQLFSRWSSKTRTVRGPLIACMTCMAVGNIIYFLVPMASVPLRKWMMLIGRLILGAGDNSLALLQGYASTASTPKDRPKAVAVMTCGLSVGFAVAPALQICFSPIGRGFRIFGEVGLDMYSAPAAAALVSSICAILLMRFVFVEEYAGISSKTEEKSVNLPPPDRLAFFTFVNLEAIGAAYVETYFGEQREDVVVFISASHIACGLMSMILYFSYIFMHLGKKVNARLVVIGSFLAFCFFYLVTFQWPFIGGNIKTYTEAEFRGFLNGTSEEEPLGCNIDRYSWCEPMAPSSKWLYFVAFAFCIGLGWPNINVCLLTIYSTVIGPRHQAYYQGILQICASAARLTGPIFMSALFRSAGPRYVWGVEIVALSIYSILLSVFYKRLVPLETAQERKRSKATVTVVEEPSV
uniref:MFS domain-containing protein n=1 Tax=Bursaphelenchus xylophilus TaxID=6326 RepID=A0A1I7RWS4_BURXY